MAVTPVGNPYVESSDLVANYPGVSEALAERIDVVGVNPFADSAARATAIPSPTEGMMSSLNDTDAVERYDGATWKPVGGKVLQVVSVTKVDSFSTTSTSYVDVTGLTANITPASVSSKILVLCKIGVNPRGVLAGYIQLVRGSTVIAGGTVVGSRTSAMSVVLSNAGNMTGDANGNFLDSPASVSSQTYKIQLKTGSGTTGINTTSNDGNTALDARTSSTITLMEISE